MRQLYKIEMIIAIFGIFAAAAMLLSDSSNLSVTGFVSADNLTVYIQNLELYVDGTQSYNLASMGDNLNLESFRLSGEIIGAGRVEIFLDNNRGSQYLVYKNLQKKIDYNPRNLITSFVVKDESQSIQGQVVNDENSLTKLEGTWLIVQPKPLNVIYEFSPLAENERKLNGTFYMECTETCNIPLGEFDSDNYELIFRIEKGTYIQLNRLEYTLHENEK